MKTNKYNSLIKDIILFALSRFIPKAIGFFLIPLYTSFLTTNEYGISDLINTTATFFMPLFTLNIRDAVLRFTLDKKYDKKESLNISLRIILFDLIILVIFTLIELNSKVFNINPLYLIFFDIILVANSIHDIFDAFCKGTDKISTIVAASIANSIITLSLNILLIVVLKKGLLGFLIANSTGLIVADLIYLLHPKLYKYFSKKYSKKQAREMVLYSFPMIFSAIAWWVNNSSDRYIISFILGVSASGIYAVASKIPTIISTIESIFMQAWSISAIKNFDKDDDDGFIGNMYTIMSCILTILCSFIILFNMIISKIMFSGDFYIAWKFAPGLVFSVMIDGIALFIGNLLFAVKDTKSRAKITILGAIVNTILNIILINTIGVYGAVIATMVGYTVGFIYSRIIIKKHIKMKTNMKLNDSVLLLLVVQVILAYYGNKYILLQIPITITIIILYRKYIFKIILKLVQGIKTKIVKSNNVLQQ